MVSSWNTLHQEIIWRVLSHLWKKNDIEACELTCKNWSQPAQEYLYKDTNIVTYEKCQKFIQGMQSRPNYPAKVVKTISFGMGGMLCDWNIAQVLDNSSRAVPMCKKFKPCI
jgi:hypothetical protein